jgi:ferritin-like metal-binding protein YciE
MSTDVSQKLIKNLTDVHAIEEQALVQLRRAPGIVSAQSEIAHDFEVHLAETVEQERAVRARLEALGAEPSTLKDLAGKAGGLGMAFFAQTQPDSVVKLIAHAFSYEHLEGAAYELLRAAATRADDAETDELARRIGTEERQMAERLEERFPDAVDAELADLSEEQIDEQLNAYLSDAHAVEEQALQLLVTAPSLVDDAELKALFSEHHTESQVHRERLEQCLEARGGKTSALKDAALRLGAFNLGAFFKLQPDTNTKLAGFAFAFEHLEIAIYSMLAVFAERAGDAETCAIAITTLEEERAAADRLGTRLEAVLKREYARHD